MIMLRMLAFKPVSGTETVATPTKKAITEPARSAPAAASAPMPEKKPVAMSTPKAPSATDNWADILTQLSLTGMTQALASHCVLGQLTDNMIELILSAKHQPLLNAKLQERLSEAINRHFNKTLQLQITISKAELNTYAKQQEETQKTRHANAFDAITSDNHVQKIMDVFGATLDLDSIKAVDPS
jgi:DNA polymerase-3 subunit gamma/tau